VFGATLINNLGFVVAIVACLFVGKFLAAWATRATFGYAWPATLTMWSLSLPQVAATLAAAMAAYDAVNGDGDRLITESVLNAVIVLMVLTAVIGPVLTERFGRRMATEEKADENPEAMAGGGRCGRIPTASIGGECHERHGGSA
jgi:Kef-type K+ transport system membrane component KefB